MTPENAAKKYPNIFKIGEDGILEMYCDNHILSSYRKCPGYFDESMLNHLGTKGRSWSLEFGQYFHKVMEYFYKAQKDKWEGKWMLCKNDFIANTDDIVYAQNLETFLYICKYFWDNYELDFYNQLLWYDGKAKKNIPHPSYAKLGGYTGAFNLFLQYYNNHFQTERLRVVGTELSFGRGREVRINEDVDILFGYNNFRAFYCGRIDLVVDDGTIIGPMDHKTTSYFDGTEGSGFKPHDGMQGYVYSFQKMLPENLKAQGRSCNSIYINHISLQTKTGDPTGSARFKHSIISYTPAEMEEWRLRQVRTFTDIYRHVVLEEPIYWDTERCGAWFGFQDCPYKILHEAAPQSREVIAKGNFIQLEPWNYERV